MNNIAIHVSENPLSNSIICLGTTSYDRTKTDLTFSLARRLFDVSLDLRRSGSFALDACTVACGRADLAFEATLNPWDYAAASCVLQEAGGLMSQLDGTPVRLDRPSSIICGSTIAYREFFDKGYGTI